MTKFVLFIDGAFIDNREMHNLQIMDRWLINLNIFFIQ